MGQVFRTEKFNLSIESQKAIRDLLSDKYGSREKTMEGNSGVIYIPFGAPSKPGMVRLSSYLYLSLSNIVAKNATYFNDRYHQTQIDNDRSLKNLPFIY